MSIKKLFLVLILFVTWHGNSAFADTVNITATGTTILEGNANVSTDNLDVQGITDLAAEKVSIPGDNLTINITVQGDLYLYGNATIDVPGDVVTEPGEPGSLRISWVDNSDDEDGFKLYRGSAVIATLEPNVTDYVDADITKGQQYCYTVTAYNDGGESPPSNQSCATVP